MINSGNIDPPDDKERRFFKLLLSIISIYALKFVGTDPPEKDKRCC